MQRLHASQFMLPNLAASSPTTNAQREEFGDRQRPPTRWRRRENSTNGGPCAGSRLKVLDSGLGDRRRLVIGRFALRHALRHMAILHRLAASIRSAATCHVNVIRQLAACNVTGPRHLVATLTTVIAAVTAHVATAAVNAAIPARRPTCVWSVHAHRRRRRDYRHLQPDSLHRGPCCPPRQRAQERDPALGHGGQSRSPRHRTRVQCSRVQFAHDADQCHHALPARSGYRL